jgi:hypothetical protein
MSDVADQVTLELFLLLFVAVSHLLLLRSWSYAGVRIENAIFICLCERIEEQLLANLNYFLRAHNSNHIVVARKFTQSFPCWHGYQTSTC